MVEDGKFIESSFWCCFRQWFDCAAVHYSVFLVNMANFCSWIIFAAVLTVRLMLGSTTLWTFAAADIKFAWCFSVFAHGIFLRGQLRNSLLAGWIWLLRALWLQSIAWMNGKNIELLVENDSRRRGSADNEWNIPNRPSHVEMWWPVWKCKRFTTVL